MSQEYRSSEDHRHTGLVYEETIPLRVSDKLRRLEIRAGIDRGSTLCKIAFLPKGTALDTEFVPLRCLTFHNDHYIAGLRQMKEEAMLPVDGKLHITGYGAATVREKIKEILELDIVFINEMVTIGHGPYVFIQHTRPDDIFCPVPDFKRWVGESKMTEGIIEGVQKKVEASEELFPALVLYMGSGCGLMSVDKDGVTTLQGTTGVSGKPFIGLCNVVLGTTDYHAIMTLAEGGDCTKADLTVGDVIKDDPDHPYGSFPPDMPTYPFGKSSETSWDRTQCSRADLAASLVGMAVFGVVLSVFTSISVTGLNKIYVSGNFFRHELPRRLFYEKLTALMIGVDLDIRFIKNGHAGAIAAMFVDNEDESKLMKS